MRGVGRIWDSYATVIQVNINPLTLTIMYDRFLITNSHFKTFFRFNAQIRYRISLKTFLHCILVEFHNRTPTQRVFINQNSSKSYNIDCAILQGSYSGLWPILFNMYLADSTSLRTTYLVSICTQMIFSCICPSCHSRHLLNMMHSSEKSKLQSQTKIVGSLPPNTVYTSGPSPRPPNVVNRS